MLDRISVGQPVYNIAVDPASYGSKFDVTFDEYTTSGLSISVLLTAGWFSKDSDDFLL